MVKESSASTGLHFNRSKQILKATKQKLKTCQENYLQIHYSKCKHLLKRPGKLIFNSVLQCSMYVCGNIAYSTGTYIQI